MKIAPNKIKCINLDWLSVYCLEPKGAIMNAQWYRALGWVVEEQEYGTNQYREKFKLMNGKHVFLEIERNPYSLRENGGIFEPESCHIRLSNRTCYAPNAVQQLTDFIFKYHYEYKGISRVDVCCDLTIFDNLMKPQDLANKYMKDKIWKVHQSKLFAHSMDGDDTWRIRMEIGAFGRETKTGRTWNSLKWGSPKSPISTKLYNKTLELENNAGKFYIKDAWVKSGLCELQKVTYDYKNPKTKEVEKRAKQVCVAVGTSVKGEIPIEQAQIIDVWRVEFSISSEGRRWVDLGDNKRVDLNLTAFDNEDVRAMTFYVMSEWLFNFVYAKWINKSSIRKKERTNRCKVLQLFNTKFLHSHYKPKRITETEDPTRTEKIMMNRLIEKSKDVRLSEEYRQACWQVAKEISKEHGDWWMSDPDPNAHGLVTRNMIHDQHQNEDEIRQHGTMANTSWLEYEDKRDIEDINKLTNEYQKYRQQKDIANNDAIQYYIQQIKRLLATQIKLHQRTKAGIIDIENRLGTPI